MAFTRHYQQQLALIRELAREFADAHPALAPMLGGPSADPDVERLLEGTAFLSGMLNQKLDDEFPELLHGLTDITFPHLLRPIPPLSIVAFTPKKSMMQTTQVPAGTPLASVEVQGVRCSFRTCRPLQVHPLTLSAVELQQRPGAPPAIRLGLSLQGVELDQWRAGPLSFYIGGSYAQATDLFMLLHHCVESVEVRGAAGGATLRLGPNALHFPAFDLDNLALPIPERSFRGFGLLQQYFILPETLLFAELHGLERWEQRGKGSDFEVVIRLAPLPIPLEQVTADQFTLSAVPVVNLFPHEAEPLILDHRREHLVVRPTGGADAGCEIYSIDKVTGYAQGTVEPRSYVPLDSFGTRKGNEHTRVYHVRRRRSPVDDRSELQLRFPYASEEAFPSTETLSVELTCTNGELAERLEVGDISHPTAKSPGLLTFTNVLAPTPVIDTADGQLDLWRLLSHLSVNFMPIADAAGLRDLLGQYVFEASRDRARVAASRKRIAALQSFSTEPVDRIVRGSIMRGVKMKLSAAHDQFAGHGDLYLLASVIDVFMGVYGSINTFTQLELHEAVTGDRFTWPERIGRRAQL